MKKSEFFRKLSIEFGEAAEKGYGQEYLCIITQFGFPDGKNLRHTLRECFADGRYQTLRKRILDRTRVPLLPRKIL